MENKPGKAHAHGIIELPAGKDYAIVKADHGFVFWLFSAGEKTIAVETFKPNGVLVDTGRIYYRPDFAP
jgi:hypothetical protein